MILRVRQRSVYGNILNYPNNDLANQFCLLLNVKTLTERQLKLISAMDIKVWVWPVEGEYHQLIQMEAT